MTSQPDIQFVSRAYPPVIGGIENQNKSIYENLNKQTKFAATINKFGKKALPLFLPWAIFKALFFNEKGITLLGDGVLAIIPWFIKKLKPNKQFICIIHGLDVTYPSPIYQKLWVKIFFQSVDHFIAVSHNTKSLLIKKGIAPDNVSVIANGFDFSNINYQPDRKKLQSLLDENIENRPVILTLGRLVKRKGVAWFVRHVIPNLDPAILYIVAGSGPEEATIKNLVTTYKLSQQVKLLGQVTEAEKQILLSNSDLFIQPNIKIEHDVEGFGISVIEASAYNLPVIAADLEGLKDAINNNENGWLINSEDSHKFISKIQNELNSPQKLHELGIKFKQNSQKKFNWDFIIQQYVQVINTFQNKD